MVNSELPTTTVESSLPTIPEQTKASESDRSVIWIFVTVVCILMVISIVLGNSLVLVTTWLDKRLHQPNKYFIACLALADLLVGTFTLPIRLYLRFNDTGVAQIELCRFWMWVDISSEVASVVTLTVISIDRYIKISMPFKYRSLVTTLRSVILIILIWLISIGAAVLGLFPYNGSKAAYALPKQGCILDNPIYMTVIAILFFFGPLIIITVMYALIFVIAHQRQKMCRKGTLGQWQRASKQRFGAELLRELKTVRILLLVVVTFMLCWGPFFVIFLINTHNSFYVVRSLGKQEWSIIAAIFFSILPPFNSLCNPIIYARFDREYSKAFKLMLRRIFCCGQDWLVPKLSKSSSTQSFRLKELRSHRTSAGQHTSKEMEENNVQTHNLLE